nr:UDP-2,3-diacylglucosamine diphosphatase LpxI [Consotaella salsifontis]
MAGGGALPRIVAQEAAKQGWVPVIVAVADGRASDWSPWPHLSIPWSHVGEGLSFLRASGVKKIAIGGTISVRPDFRSMVPSFRTLSLLPDIFRAMRGGDDTLLRACTTAVARRGFEFVAIHDIAPKLLMSEGTLTRRQPSQREELALVRGFLAARRLGELDVGQAAVASPDRVIALEGIEGTREMLERVRGLRARGRIGDKEPCVLVKTVKPQQDRRFDLPAIGPSTIAEAAAAGLRGIGVSAGGALIIEADRLLSAAEVEGLFVVGRALPPETGASA